MSANTFPAQIEPFKWAEQGFSWSGSLPIARFPRIASETVPSAVALSVHVDCRLFMDQRRFVQLQAQLSATVPLMCQRCLTPVDMPIDTTVDLVLLSDAKYAERLDEDADFVILSEEQVVHGGADSDLIDLLALLEDELLLSLPLAPRHDHCDYTVPVVEIEEEPAERENPFSVLANLKQQLDS
jgi:uncharacterized protein